MHAETGLFGTTAGGVLFVGQLEVDQGKAEYTYHGVGKDYWPQHQGNGINKPYNRAEKNDEDHCHAEIPGTFRLPGFVYLRNKSHTAEKCAKVAHHLDPVD